MQIALADIIQDPRCQPREHLDPGAVLDYAQAMQAGATFPPITVFADGGRYWLADGFHRVAAAELAGVESLDADVRPGTVRDAILHATGANATHGLRRSNADKRRAVTALLDDEEWSKWSDRKIARRCSVDHKTVAAIRDSLGNSPVTGERTYTDRYGTTRTMDTENIGKRPPVELDLGPELYDEDDEDEDDEDVLHLEQQGDFADLPGETLAPFEDAMAQHSAWLAATRDDVERMESIAELRQICRTLEATTKRMKRLGIDPSETVWVHIWALRYLGIAIDAVIDAGTKAARAAIEATNPTVSQLGEWLDAINAASEFLDPNREPTDLDKARQLMDALEMISECLDKRERENAAALKAVEMAQDAAEKRLAELAIVS